MSTAKGLRSVRRLLAFACLLLSFLLIGVGDLAAEVAYGGFGPLLTFAGAAGVLVSGVWLLVTLSATATPGDDGDGSAATDGETGNAAGDGETGNAADDGGNDSND
ncbi:hypothetical protein [Halorubellus sp. PRR65]|uniref:hypothetical protein n=1 Tax=Halorubellus sp. PRR65 TaxID=3098148 RepID=UPI002B25E37A|nr:hypothetical protein [Halorubellus sp. PRR65]